MLTKHLTGKGRADSAGSRETEKSRDLSAAIEERDAAIGHLEHTIAEQQQDIATLRHTLEQAKFKTSILEQSYATQLDEARERAGSAEQSAGDKLTRIAELEASFNVVSKELDAARTRLDSLGPSDSASIDELLDSFSVSREQSASDKSEHQVDAPNDSQPHEEMLAPNVMFAAKRK